jgi:hypothetical protein
MGKVFEPIADALISPSPDRNANRIRIYRMENGEVVIHFRDLKIQLLTPQERVEWREGFARALEEVKLHDYLKNDL